MIGTTIQATSAEPFAEANQSPNLSGKSIAALGVASASVRA